MGQYAPPEKLSRNDKGIAAAQEAAARLNQKLGASVVPPFQQGSSDRQITTETTIPDRFVGLVIGKKGEQITSLQNESNCKVQISQGFYILLLVDFLLQKVEVENVLLH